ncbi:hypothetical protein BGZ61DRAFT_531598 [Ilyonectria robusta]|uniref:uncharacterized protein n=1 Tax=Ilyonectria robusta TaxID=1079257 RepID=UPI001E8E6FC5|nr:uncharacterized protein BGZ61DRAFT_531598 [Ilyonectria robusta]KAH8706405.1 hypothetical protein BGZ61DRAFT_531598 [Ilyonectria robusta]
MSRHQPTPEPRRRSSRRRSSERGGNGPDTMQPRPYLVEWSAQTCRQRGVLDVDELREEMGAPERPGWRRLVIMRGSESEMDLAVGLELAEGRGRRRASGWAWEYPEIETKADTEPSSNGRKGIEEDGPERRIKEKGIRLCRAALSTNTRIPILLLDGLPPQTPHRPPRLSRHSHQRRQSSANRPPRPENTPGGAYPPERSGLEDALWDVLGDGRPLESVLAELAYDAWLFALDSLPPHEGDSVEILWALAQALESNADTAKSMERRGLGVGPDGVTAADWTALAERLHRRMHLSVALSLQVTKQPQEPSQKANSRSLDRIAYLGGLLFPATVVSGVLSIEGTYGPEGSAFWVFWLAAGLSSIAALLIIYADTLRTLDVWMEVAAGEFAEGLDAADDGIQALRHHRRRRGQQQNFQTAGDEERGEARVTTAADGGVYVVQRRGDGTSGRAWRRRELGWLGAVKKMSGWYMMRGSPGMAFKMPGWEERVVDLW